MNGKNLILTALAGLLVLSCSTTRVLPQGKYRLTGNKVKVEGKEVRSSELTHPQAGRPACHL